MVPSRRPRPSRPSRVPKSWLPAGRVLPSWGSTKPIAPVTGPGYGNYGEARIKGVNAGNIVALHLTNATTGDSYWAFASANEKVDGKNVTHLISYGLNTYGWEAGRNGGDHDDNDLIVGIDFTSGAGHALIA